MSRVDRASVFAALGDPVRLELLARMGDGGSGGGSGGDSGGGSITRLAEGLPITRQAVTRHLRVLERARLIEARREGRETRFVARPARIREVKTWLDDVARQWDGTLGRLKAHVEKKGR